MTKSYLPYLLMLSMALSSCSKLEGMSDNAVKASENSGRAANAAEASREEIANGRIMTRAGSAKDARGKALERMKERESLEGKVVEAATYFKAFEYQLWTGQKYDSEVYLHSLMEDAFNEIYRNLKELNDEKSLTETNPTAFRILGKRKKRDRNILALALALHKVHGLQTTRDPMTLEGVDREFKEGTSPLDLIKSALVKINQYENGYIGYGEFLPHEVVIYEKIEEFMALVNVRYNMILTLALSELTNIDESKVSALLSFTLPTKFKKLKSEYLDINDAKKYAANKYLTKAYELKEFMSKNGYELVMYKDINKIFKKLVTPSRDDSDVIILSSDDRTNLNKHYDALESLFEVDGNRIISEK